MKKISILLYVLLLFLGTSCSRKNYAYLQDMQEMQEYPVGQKFEPIIRRDDKLSILVNSSQPELALPFNIPGTGGYTVGADGTITTVNNSNSTSDKIKPGYLVDTEGNIDFPFLGKLHVDGLTRAQVTELVRQRLIADGYLKDPVVMVNFQNFKISVLGEVGRVGTFDVADGRITLLEAIALAGDLKPTSRFDRIAVIREFGDNRRIFFHDIRSKDLFTSPCYYLQQNDIVYVEPNGTKAAEQSQRNFNLWSMVISSITTLTTMILYFVK